MTFLKNIFFNIRLLAAVFLLLAVIYFPHYVQASSTVTLFVNDCVDSDCNNTPTTTVSNVPESSPESSYSGGQGYGEKPKLYVSSISVQQKQTSVTITWVTSTNSINTLSWGTTTNYELGTIGETSSRHNHEVTLNALMPDTHYYFKIVGTDVYGSNIMYVASFTTVSIASHIPPPNISKPTLNLRDDGLHISWLNSRDINFNGVRIVRSEYHYPKNPDDGKVIYEGKASSVIDANVDLRKILYYGIFSVDRGGEYSSGTLFNFNGLPDSGIPQVSQSTSTINVPFSDLIFLQNGNVLSIASSTISVDGNERLTVLVPFGKSPFTFESVIMSIGTSSSRMLYGLSASDQDEAYVATIGERTIYPGLYPITIIGTGTSSSVALFSGVLYVTYAKIIEDFLMTAFWIVVGITCFDVIFIIVIEIARFFHKKHSETDV